MPSQTFPTSDTPPMPPIRHYIVALSSRRFRGREKRSIFPVSVLLAELFNFVREIVAKSTSPSTSREIQRQVTSPVFPHDSPLDYNKTSHSDMSDPSIPSPSPSLIFITTISPPTSFVHAFGRQGRSVALPSTILAGRAVGDGLPSTRLPDILRHGELALVSICGKSSWAVEHHSHNDHSSSSSPPREHCQRSRPEAGNRYCPGSC